MGTYTTNKELYKPSVGETGWGTLVNENFTTIDTFLKPITVSGSTYTFTGNQTGGTVTATKITNSGTLTNTGKITANGGIAGTTGTFSGAVTGSSFNGFIPRVYTFKIDTTGNTSFTGTSIATLTAPNTTNDTWTLSCYMNSGFNTNFGTKSGTAQFLYEDSKGRLYQFTDAVLPTSGITYRMGTRSNATLKVNNMTISGNSLTTCTANDIKNILTKPFSYTMTTTGTASNGNFLLLSFENIESGQKYVYMI